MTKKAKELAKPRLPKRERIGETPADQEAIRRGLIIPGKVSRISNKETGAIPLRNDVQWMWLILGRAIDRGFRHGQPVGYIPSVVRNSDRASQERFRIIHPMLHWRGNTYLPWLTHAFAQAFFGEDWKTHLQAAVLYEHPIEYYKEVFLREYQP